MSRHRPHTYIYIYICVYEYVVKLKAGPMFAIFKVKNWSTFLFISVSLQKEETFKKQKQQQKTQISKVKNWSNLLRNILGPVLNLDLDQLQL